MQFIRENRKIILIVDNAGGHNLSDEFKKKITNIRIEYLAPNCTSVIQPCDAGIIRAFKAKYRSKIIRHILRVYEEKNKYEEIDVKQAIYYIRETWREVSKQTIKIVGKKQK